jgi:MoCo/4Fe-4S cofactor protein with predicted Tat translocation signal
MIRDADKTPGASLADVREKLAAKGSDYAWRSIEEIADTDEFREYLEREFPKETAPWASEFDRRSFLKVMGASLAMAGLAACRPQLAEKIVPYVKAPEEVIPGTPLFYATTLTLGGYALGVLVESNTGRPTKIEGNPNHPASLGSTDAWTQGMILGLYDPDRSASVMNGGQPSKLDSFVPALRTAVSAGSLRILTETITSPTLAAQIQKLLAASPGSKWHTYEALNSGHAKQGAELAFGKPVSVRYDLTKAEVILSIDADFLHTGPGRVRYAREFAEGRRVRKGTAGINRLYVIESSPTLTGAMADNLKSLPSYEVEAFAVAVAGALSGAGNGQPKALARDLEAHKGRCAVIVGESMPPEIHALGHWMNEALGNVGSTVFYSQPVEPEGAGTLAELSADMKAGKVSGLLILGGNPAYTAPADMGFAESLGKVPFSAHLGLYQDETAKLCKWHIPMAHELEAWGDARAFDGTTSIIQPLIEPLLGGVSAIEVIDAALGADGRSSHDIVRDHWKQLDEKAWRKALHDGIVAGTSLPPVQVSAKPIVFAGGAKGSGFEIAFRPDATVYDGRFANNAWMQELPKPLTKLTWDNVAMVSPVDAEKLGLDKTEGGTGKNFMVPVIEISLGGRSLKAPAWIMPGHPDGVITLTLGLGRKAAGRVGNGVGYDAYSLRTSTAMWSAKGAEVKKTAERYELASTQQHHSMEDREIVLHSHIDEFLAKPDMFEREEEPSIYPERPYEGNAWGLAVDLNVCTGCNACVTACQAENNIPSVGKKEVLRGREMHWIRIDRYYRGGLEAPTVNHMPVMCMHCERAPCEVVCPVAATSHGAEGLNEMVYNRCVGTRYCSNNCPYKVRRFNFLQYTDHETPLLKMMRNPDVTVRGRGVMEKCSYCVQRINSARKTAKKEGRPIKDGEIVTACQQACPTQAIVFGNINDPKSKVSEAKGQPQNYGLLQELNTKPRTTYLAKFNNPNPDF